MFLYVWSKKNPQIQMSLFGILNFKAPYAPWVMLGLTFILGHGFPTGDVVGIVVGHIYYFLEDVYPKVNNRHIIKTPRFL